MRRPGPSGWSDREGTNRSTGSVGNPPLCEIRPSKPAKVGRHIGRPSWLSMSESDISGIDKRSLRDVLDEIEAALEPTHPTRIASTIRTWAAGGGGTPASALENMAFSFHAHEHQDPSVWDLYFGPMMSGATDSGERWDVPSLDDVSGDSLEYWAERARESTHPVMCARYADLCWELPKGLHALRPNHEMARAAVDAYLAAVRDRLYDHPVAMRGALERALQIALEVKDSGRTAEARDALIVLESEIAEDDSPGLWGFAFDALIEPPRRAIPVSDEQISNLVEDLEARLQRFDAAEATGFHPSGAEAAALRLAAYYRRAGATDDVRRVMDVYGNAVLKMKDVAAPMVFASCLETLHEHLLRFGLNSEAKRLTGEIREAGARSLSEMEPITTEVSVPKEKIDEFFSELLQGTGDAVLTRIAVHFLPRQDQLEEHLLELARDAPLSFLFNHSILDENGRTVARVGPIESDLEGQLVRHASQSLSLGVPWLRQAIERAKEQNLVSLDDVVSFVSAGAPFRTSRLPILLSGLEAFDGGDYLTAVHVLVPQIEAAIRHLAGLVQAPTLTPRRGGGFHARGLDDLLREPAIKAVLGHDVVTYFRVLLTDARGWNVRNIVCHGLAAPNMFDAPVADRLFHAVLVLSLVRERDEEPVEDRDGGGGEEE